MDISNTKRVALSEHYEHLDGPFFTKFIRKYFVKVFNRSNNPGGNILVQVGDTPRTCNLAKLAKEHVNSAQFSIPPWRPDCNLIEIF